MMVRENEEKKSYNNITEKYEFYTNNGGNYKEFLI